MTARRSSLVVWTLASLSLLASCSRSPAADQPDELALVDALALEHLDRSAVITLALDHEPGERADVIARLRADGPAGLDALIAEYRRVPERSAAEDAAWRALIDEVAAQRDAHYGGLFWYRDIDEARAAAAASGKPILSLRLLGELTSEFSCANSRLFRTLLYADPELARWLEQRFVLHWSSERPVPRLAIDFGDGRKVERTITGNSAHFVLDAQGRTLDVIPGLLATASFRAALDHSLALHEHLAAITSDDRWRAELAADHQRRFDATTGELAELLAQVRRTPPQTAALRAWLATPKNPTGAAVPAARAVPMAVGKSKIEAPILAKLPDAGALGQVDAPVAPTDDELWRLGVALAGEVALHPNSEAIIARERPLDELVAAAEREAVDAALRAALIRSIQADTGKNALELHPRIHLELAARAREDRSLGFADVDAWLYTEVFETPADDPWLGLIDPAVYTGLERGGVIAD